MSAPADTSRPGQGGAAIIAARTVVEALGPHPGDDQRATFRNSAGQERSFTYAQLSGESRRRAAALARLGLERHDRVALLLHDEADMALWFLAGILAGLVPVLIAPRNATRPRSNGSTSLEHIVASSGARLVLTTATLAEGAHRALVRQANARVIAIEDLAGAVGETDGSAFEPVAAQPDDICYLQYTSGSTSEPKGVIITHANVFANVRATVTTAWTDGPHHFVGWMPLYHDFGLVAFLFIPLLTRLPMTLLSSGLFVRRPQVWLDAMHERRATVTAAPNFAFNYLLRRLRNVDLARYDLSSLRLLFCGAEPIQRDAFQGFADHLAVTGLDPRCFLPCYGLAESTLGATLNPTWHGMIHETVCSEALRRGVVQPPRPTAPAKTLVGCGQPLPDHHVEVIGDDGNVLGEGRVGQIRIKGPSVSPGYFGNPEATRESWRDGWFHTGDLGYFRQGHLYVCGRIKDLIIVRGANYYPQDFEWTVARLGEASIRNTVAFPIDAGGEESFAVVVEADLEPAEREAFRNAVAEAIIQEHGVAPAEVLAVRTGALPLTTSGKVQRRQSRQMFERGEFTRAPVARAESA